MHYTLKDTESRSSYLTVRIKPALRERILADAEANEMSQSQVVRSILAKYYEGKR